MNLVRNALWTCVAALSMAGCLGASSESEPPPDGGAGPGSSDGGAADSGAPGNDAGQGNPETLDGLVVASALQLSAPSVTLGGSLTGTATLVNTGTSPVALQAVAIAARQPGFVVGVGPYLDLYDGPAQTIAPGATFVLTGGRPFISADPIGSWYAYITVQDSTGAWHDSADHVSFSVVAATGGQDGGSGGGSDAGHGGTPGDPGFSPLHVSGNLLVNAAGQTVVLHGVNRSGSEFACIQGYGFFDGNDTTSDDAQAPLIKAWGVNAVNFGLNEDCWLNINTSGLDAAYLGQNYINAMVHEVQTLESYGIYPIVSFFWMAPGTTRATDQSPMPDNDHAPALWKSVAETFKDDPLVIFRLKEEPYPGGNGDSATIWSCWKNGDVQYDTSNTLTPVSQNATCSEAYPTVGMQSLVNIIRGTGASNVIQVPGIQYADTMDQFLAYVPADPLHNLMGVVDVYPETSVCGGANTTCYDSQYLPVIQAMPFMAGEIGEDANGASSSTADVDVLMSWFDQHGAGYSAWTWDTWGGALQLITDYGTGNPKGPWGTDYKTHVSNL